MALVQAHTCPLNMQVITCRHRHPLWEEVILHGRVNLDYISPLPAHVQIQDSLILELRLSWYDLEDMRAILERTTELSCVYCQLKRDLIVVWFAKLYFWVVLDDRVAESEIGLIVIKRLIKTKRMLHYSTILRAPIACLPVSFRYFKPHTTIRDRASDNKLRLDTILPCIKSCIKSLCFCLCTLGSRLFK